MKNFLNATLLFLAILLPLIAPAHDFEVDGIYYNKNGDRATVTYRGSSYNEFSNEYSGEVVIPNFVTYNGTCYTVTSIGNEAFASCIDLTSIEIPSSVSSIGHRAFLGCRNLANVSIPNSVISIGQSAFNSTAWYDNQSDGIVYAGSVVYNYKGTMPNGTNLTLRNGIRGIAYKAFYNCTGLTSIEIPQSIVFIDDYAFSACTSLSHFVIPDSVPSIGNHVFSGCTGLTCIDIPNSVTSIGEYAFASCKSLESVVIPNSVTTIDSFAFADCNKLTSVEIPNSMTYLGTGMFYRCSSLTSINIPYSVTSINNRAFDGCSSLTSIVIPNSVTHIGIYAFDNCTGLTSIHIPRSVNSIDFPLFFNGNNLTEIIVESGNSVYDSRENCNAIIETAGNILKFGCQNTIIPNQVTIIDTRAFANCISLTNINFPNSVTLVKTEAFYKCTNLSNIVFPSSMTSIGEKAFYSCKNLTTIVFPNSMTFIGSEAFNGCTNLANIEFPNTITHISNGAFLGTAWYNSQPNGVVYAGLIAYKYKGTMPVNTNIALRAGTIGITADAFSDCKNMTSIWIPNSVTYIVGNPFYGCSGLESIVVEKNNPIYDSRDNCNAIIMTEGNILAIGCKNTIIPNTVISIQTAAFGGCTSLTSIDIPNSIVSIETYAFEGCSNLGNIVIPNSVTKLNDRTFYDCRGLTSITLPESLTQIGEFVFYHCNALTTVKCLALTPPEIDITSFLYSSRDTLEVPSVSVDVYRNHQYWGMFQNIIPIETIIGDIDGNGRLSISDVTNLIDHLLNGGNIPANADVDGDGVVNIKDVTFLIDMLLSGN